MPGFGSVFEQVYKRRPPPTRTDREVVGSGRETSAGREPSVVARRFADSAADVVAFVRGTEAIFVCPAQAPHP
jgi:hypothetical protein